MIDRLPFQLCQFYREHVANDQPLALITVLSTEGSTYSKSGSQMLVNGQGDFQGMLSGGCLEGDLAERSEKVIASGVAAKVEYDLRGDDDVFGFGVGCEGALQILIQPLILATNYEPFASVIESLDHGPYADLLLADTESEFGVVRLGAPLRVLILGAGQDADPLIDFAVTMGWEVAVADHRPASIERLGACRAHSVSCISLDDAEFSVNLSRIDAAIVMSHNLRADRIYLQRLANSPVAFIGLLGPAHRRERLLGEMGEDANKLADRLRGPVGRPIGGRGPAAIALEIAAEIQARFFGKGEAGPPIA